MKVGSKSLTMEAKNFDALACERKLKLWFED